MGWGGQNMLCKENLHNKKLHWCAVSTKVCISHQQITVQNCSLNKIKVVWLSFSIAFKLSKIIKIPERGINNVMSYVK